MPQGLQVHALAAGFEHPRSLYVLPNGDVLVVETNGPKAPIHRPKDLVTAWATWLAGAKAKTTSIRRLGVVLVGNELYVANTDALVRYPYQEGQTNITAPGTKLTDLPGGPIAGHTQPLCGTNLIRDVSALRRRHPFMWRCGR